jgi:uncharacterized protein (DUF362 family)
LTDKSGKLTRVVIVKHIEKLSAMQEVLTQTNFFDLLENQWINSGKTRSDFLIAIKPNIMLGYSHHDPATFTDPELVEFMIDRIVERGFTNIAVVESQNVYSNWFRKRDVITVASYFGYTQKNYRIFDLTKEKIKYDYKGRLGKHWIGPTWRDADFRISFAKNKTHVSCLFTLTLKNVFGCLPLQNKFKHYHKIREIDWPTIELLKHFPCNFGFIDGIWSADGLLGLKADYTPRNTQTIIGGENLIAVDWVGARKMGLNPTDSRILTLAMAEFGMPEIECVGDQSIYENWVNVHVMHQDKMLL